MRHATATLFVLFAMGIPSLATAEEPLFPFVISYDALDNAANLSGWLDCPAGKRGFVRAADGHFATDAGPIRFWGTNICFTGCFPEHDQAERVAARLARLGINCVRMHHMDSFPIWGDSPNKLTIDPKQLERLDYFIHQLKQHGVYVNLNLHVSRWLGDAEGFPNQHSRPDYDKGIGMIEPRMIELQKKYARDLLTHVNPYSKTAYIDEPAVAFVEISNEDSLFFVWTDGKLGLMSEPYATTLRKLWNGWLRKKYGTTEKLREAWNATMTPPGDEMLRNGDFTQSLQDGWNVERDEITRDRFEIQPDAANPGKQSLRISVEQQGRLPWNPQMTQSGLGIRKGAVYTLSFRMRSDTVDRCRVSCQMAHHPWQGLGLTHAFETGPQWRNYRYTFLGSRDDPNGRIVFSDFRVGANYELADVSFRQGGELDLKPDQTLENDGVPAPVQNDTRVFFSNDFCDFLWDAELDYWTEMHRFLKEELGVRSLICGTQLGFSPVHVQSRMDYIDNHAYWQHPNFPHRPWDPKDWTIDDVAMVNTPGATLAHMARCRVAGKPYTVSEYNHPAPNSYSAEGFPMIAAFAAFQNWDGVYSFAYTHNPNYEPSRIESFFDLKSHTAQLAHFPACVAMFVRGDVKTSVQPEVFAFPQNYERQVIHQNQSAYNLTVRELAGNPNISLDHASSLDLGAPAEYDPNAATDPPPAADRYVSDTGEICWDVSEKDAGYFTVNTPRTKLWTGFVRGRTFQLGGVTLKIEPTRLDWATVSMTAIDGEALDRPGRILVAATGWVQNQDEQIQRLDRNQITLGDQWGREPVLCEGIRAALTLPLPANRVQCYPLDGSGNRREAITVGQEEGAARIELDPRHKTVWYELVVLPPDA